MFSSDRIEPRKFSVGNPYDTDETFIRAIIKVQQGKEDELTGEEALVLEPWKLDSIEGITAGAIDEEEEEEELSAFELKVREREQKESRVKSGDAKSTYHPALKSCVLGSAAAAERVWSMAGKVLTDERSSMSPLVFELIMYLKYNKRLWDISDVIEANKRRCNESSASKKRAAIQKERLQKMRTEVLGWNPAGHGESLSG